MKKSTLGILAAIVVCMCLSGCLTFSLVHVGDNKTENASSVGSRCAASSISGTGTVHGVDVEGSGGLDAAYQAPDVSDAATDLLTGE